MPTLYLHVTIFTWEEQNFIRYEKVHSVKHTSSTFTRIKLCKRPEVNSEPTHLKYDIISVGDMHLPMS